MSGVGAPPPMQFSGPNTEGAGRFSSVDAFRQSAAAAPTGDTQGGDSFRSQLAKLDNDIRGFSRRLSVSSAAGQQAPGTQPAPGGAPAADVAGGSLTSAALDVSRAVSAGRQSQAAQALGMIPGIPSTASVAMPSAAPEAAPAVGVSPRGSLIPGQEPQAPSVGGQLSTQGGSAHPQAARQSLAAGSTALARQSIGADSAVAAQVGSLYQTMGQVNSHLETEQVQKRKMQDEIDQLKLQLTMSAMNTSNAMGNLNTLNAQQSTHVSALERELKEKAEEIASLREEKAVMKEWLDRGVNECRRVAEEVQRLRKEIEENDGERGRLEEEKMRLESMLQQVMQDVKDTSGRLEREKKDKEHILASVLAEKEEALGTLTNTERSMMQGAEKLRITQVECERLAMEVARQMERIRDLEEGEMYLRALVCGLKRLAHGFVAFHTAVEEDRMGDFTGSSTAANEADVEAAGSGPLEGVANVGKTCLAELQDVLLALRSVVRSRLEETKERCVSVQRKEAEAAQAAVDGARRVERDLRERHNIEKKILEEKLEELEAELSGLSEEHIRARRQLNEQAAQNASAQLRATVAVSAAAPVVHPTSTHERHYIDPSPPAGDELAQAKVVALQAKCAKLEQSYTKLKEKNKKMKVDWSKVSDTRAHCQKLEIEKRTMQSYIDKVEMENEALRRRLFNNNIGTMAGSVAGVGAPRALSPSKQVEADKSSAVWREWQNTQVGWEDWKEGAMRRGGGGAMSPSASARGPRPTFPVHPSMLQTPHTQRSFNPSSPHASGPWMPQS